MSNLNMHMMTITTTFPMLGETSGCGRVQVHSRFDPRRSRVLASLGDTNRWLAMGLLCFALLLPDSALALQGSMSRSQPAYGTEENALVVKFNAIDWSAGSPAGVEDVVKGMRTSPELRVRVLDEFQRTTHGMVKHHCRELLWLAPTPELSALAKQWARDKESPTRRFDGFSLLLRLGRDEETEALIHDAMFNEQNADVISEVLYVLMRQDIPPPMMTKRVVARLHDLTNHQHSVVRQRAVQKLAEWDKSRQIISTDIMRLLLDQDDEVRAAAIGAISISGLRTDQIKKELIQIVGDIDQSPDVRFAAKMNLQEFEMSEIEYEEYRKHR